MEPSAVPDLWVTLLKSCAMLCLVLGALLLFLYAVKRLSGMRGKGDREGLIRMLASYPVAPRERILLMEVMGERILIGVTAQSINCLAVINGDGEVEPGPSSEPTEKRRFQDVLKGARRARKERSDEDSRN